MALFSRRKPEARATSLAQLQTLLDRSGLTASGIVVDHDRAMRNSSVWACIELIASTGSSLPLDQYRQIDGTTSQVQIDLLFTNPDPDPSVTGTGFRGQLLRSAVTRGNAYAMLVVDPVSGRPTAAVTLHPDRVVWRYEQGWQTYVDGKPVARWPLGPLWHFALFQQPGSPVGLNPIEYHKQTIGASIAAQRFGAQFFDSGGNPSLIIQVPEEPTAEQSKALKAKVLDVTRGNREPLVLPQEMRIERVSIPPDDSQFLETQRYGTEEIARIFLGGFPELIGSAVTGGGSITYANREQRLQDFLTLSLAPRYLVPLEAALSSLLPPNNWVRHNFDALLRSDLAGRYQSYKTAAEVSQMMGAPLLTVNEMRAYEGLPPVDAGDALPAEAVAADSQPSIAETVQKVYLGVGKVITSDEARQIVNDAGGNLQVPGPVFPTDTPAVSTEAAQRDAGDPFAIIADVDGTLLHADGSPNVPVVEWCNQQPGVLFIITGRFDGERDETTSQLDAAGVRPYTLVMRPASEDDVPLWKLGVAGGLLHEYDVLAAIDNDQHNRAKYASLGIPTIDPAEL